MEANFMTTTQAAKVLGISIRRVQQLIGEGQLPAIKAGRDWLIRPEDLERVKDRPGPGRPPKSDEPGA